MCVQILRSRKTGFFGFSPGVYRPSARSQTPAVTEPNQDTSLAADAKDFRASRNRPITRNRLIAAMTVLAATMMIN